MENFRELPAEKEIQYRGRLLLIWNPVAGKKQSKRYLPDIIALYSELGYRVEVVATRGPGSVPYLIRRFGHEADRIVTIGGDGTFNETISGVLREGLDVPLGYIPAGSTNDLASSLSLSSNIMTAARDAVLGEAKTLDVGLFNGRPFSYIAGFGAFTATSYSTPQNLKNLLGHTAYVLSGINELSNIHPTT